jgi:hypothetical protein
MVDSLDLVGCIRATALTGALGELSSTVHCRPIRGRPYTVPVARRLQNALGQGMEILWSRWLPEQHSA